jgi:isopenicillin N synthase-like dioxygenase
MAVPSFSLPALVAAAEAPDGAGRDLLEELDAALIDPGAFRMTDLPVSTELVEKMHFVTNAFFEEPLELKARYRDVDDQYVGWCGSTYLSEYGSADTKEMFHIGPRVAPTLVAHTADGSLPPLDSEVTDKATASCALWPSQPDGFVQVWHEYYRAMQEVSSSFGRVLAAVLGIPAGEWFDVLQGNWADLAANYYPPVASEDGAGKPIYNAAHRDLTIFTILHQDESRAGTLSVQSVDGSWTDVEPIQGTYVVNVGELLTYLSGGRWRAAPHQVTVAPDSEALQRARISVPFFFRPSDEIVVRSFVDPDAPPIAVGDWVLDRKRSSAARGS